MKIEIPNYRSVVENQIYSGEKQVKQGELSWRDVIFLEKYTQPTEEQVINYLKKKAKSAKSLTGINLINRSQVSDLEVELLNFPIIIDHILKGDEGFIEYTHNKLRPHIFRDCNGQPSTYLSIRYGKAPPEMDSQKQIANGLTNRDKYLEFISNHEIIGRGFGLKWNLKLLLHNGLLPERAIIDFLMKHGTYGSRTFEIDPPSYSIEEVGGVLDDVYKSLSDPELSSLILDTSDLMTDSFSSYIIREIRRKSRT